MERVTRFNREEIAHMDSVVIRLASDPLMMLVGVAFGAFLGVVGGSLLFDEDHHD